MGKYSTIEKQLSLESKLKRILAKEDLAANKALIEVSARHLKLDYLDLAAALLFINDPNPILSASADNKFSLEKQKAFELLQAQMVRYRIEVGRLHKVSVKQIKEIFIEVSGVEHKKIGYIDIFDHYTVLSLPAGMPIEIFHVLKEIEIQNRPLDIKRLNGSGKKFQTDKNYRKGTRRHYLSANKKQHHLSIKTGDK